MRINHNLGALNTYSKLSAANFDKSKSLEKLSSGLRINKAGDDAAGLAISEKMRGQIRGLDQAERNAQDGISMIQTAEGALQETHSILQRMRELTVQAANDTNTDDDRNEIQNEVNQLSSEINRISGNTEFNKTKLLDGSQSATAVSGATVMTEQAGKNSVEAAYCFTFNICMGVGSATEAAMEFNTCAFISCLQSQVCTSTLSNYVASVAMRFNACLSLSGQWTAEASGNKLIITAKDGVAAVCGTSGNGKALCIYANCGAKTTTCIVAVDGNICNGFNTTDDVRRTDGRDSVRNIEYLELGDSAIKEGTKIEIGNRKWALWDSSAGTYTSQAAMKCALGLDICWKIFDISSSSYDEASEIMACLHGCTDAFNTTISYDCANGRMCVIAAAGSGANGSNYTSIKVSGASGTSSTEGNGQTLQIGANAGQTFTATFGDMTGAGVGVTGTAGGGSVTASDGEVAYFTSTANVEKEGETTEFALDISTAEKATAAISVIDDAIQAVSSERSKYGAYQNRLEHTIANLGTSSENLTAAESRIRDVDMAKEMMEFTKNNILGQAATSMLSQANQQTQGVLSLLR